MKRKRFWLTAAICFGLGAWAGIAIQRAPVHAFAIGSAASAAEPGQKESTAKPDQPAKPAASVTEQIAGKKPAPAQGDGKLRIICFGAHPDDCELQASGTAALWAAQGHHVKFVAVTNGDIGHWRDAGGPLARRRNAEVQRAADVLGITTEVLDNHDGELMPTLENRAKITRLIREWKADIVMGPRTNDYHPDHRYTGVLVQDAAYMVAVPFYCPDTPALERNPVFFYFHDHFQKPYPFQADVVIGIDKSIEQKVDGLVGMESQFVEGGVSGSADLIAGGEKKLEQRRRMVREAFLRRDQEIAKQYRDQLIKRYGAEAGNKVEHAEAFEICEYGRQPSKDELKRLFPF